MNINHTTTGRLPRRLLGVWAHPDDEAYLSAALMGRVIDSGGHVTSAAVTLGELGFPSDDPRTYEERSALRWQELTDACAIVGVQDVRSLGFRDGGLGQTPLGLVVDSIADLIDDVSPDVVITFGPDGITGHQDHVVTGLATTIAAAGRPEVELLYATHTSAFLEEHRDLHRRLGMYMGDEPDGTDQADIAMSVTSGSDELFRKRLALASHSSQTTDLAAYMGEELYRSWISHETFRHPTTSDFITPALTAV